MGGLEKVKKHTDVIYDVKEAFYRTVMSIDVKTPNGLILKVSSYTKSNT